MENKEHLDTLPVKKKRKWPRRLLRGALVCLAVLGVLSLVTARAMLATAQKQADYVQQTYELEMLGQQWLSQVETVCSEASSEEELLAELPEETRVDGDLLRYVAQNSDERQLSIAVQLEDRQIRVVEWRQVRQWQETENIGQLCRIRYRNHRSFVRKKQHHRNRCR